MEMYRYIIASVSTVVVLSMLTAVAAVVGSTCRRTITTGDMCDEQFPRFKSQELPNRVDLGRIGGYSSSSSHKDFFTFLYELRIQI